MADVKLRKLDEWVVEVYRTRARAAGHSLEEEMRRTVTSAALKPRLDFARKMARLREKIRRKYGILSDSTPGIRQERDSSS
jgi:hypothetical protein